MALPSVVMVGAPRVSGDGVQDYQDRLEKHLHGLGLAVGHVEFPREAKALPKDAILHVQYPMEGWAHDPLPVLRLAWLARRRRVVTTLHEYPDLHPLRKANIHWLVKRSAAIVCASDLVAAGVAPLLRGRKPTVIPVASNVDGGEPLDASAVAAHRARWLAGSPPGTIVLGFFGSLYAAKRPELLVRAQAWLAQAGRPAVCVFVGAVNEDQKALPQQLREEAARLGVAAPLFEGFIASSAEVRHRLAALDACVLPFHDGVSLRRGSMLAALEAGIPVVATRGPGTAEVQGTPWGAQVLASRHLVLADGDGASIGAAVQGLAESPPPRAGPMTTSTWRAVAEAHLALYRSLA